MTRLGDSHLRLQLRCIAQVQVSLAPDRTRGSLGMTIRGRCPSARHSERRDPSLYPGQNPGLARNDNSANVPLIQSEGTLLSTPDRTRGSLGMTIRGRCPSARHSERRDRSLAPGGARGERMTGGEDFLSMSFRAAPKGPRHLRMQLRRRRRCRWESPRRGSPWDPRARRRGYNPALAFSATPTRCSAASARWEAAPRACCQSATGLWSARVLALMRTFKAAA